MTPEHSILSEVLQDTIANHTRAVALMADQLTEVTAQREQLARDLAVANQLIEHLKSLPAPAPAVVASTEPPDADDGALKAAQEALSAERAARTALEQRVEAIARAALARPAAAPVEPALPKGRIEVIIADRDGNGDGKRFIIKRT